jgi:solute carrier family 25 2-oxodicarboxylate transporter 21
MATNHTSNSTWSMCFSIIRNEGFRSLYRGIGPPILMEAPKRALKFTVNDMASPALLQLSGRTSPNLAIAVCSGLTAGLTEAFVVAPFEKVKIRMQSIDSASKYTSSLDCLKKIVMGEGFLALTKGLHATMFWCVSLTVPRT